MCIGSSTAKLPGAGVPSSFTSLGPHSPSVTQVLRAPDTIEVKCISCRQTHPYRRDEIRTKIGSPPAADFVPHPLIHPGTG
jgi:hypothetical protein